MIDRTKEIITELTKKISVILANPTKHQGDFFIFLSASIVLLIILILLLTLAYFLFVPPKYEAQVVQPTDRKKRSRRFKVKIGVYSSLVLLVLAALVIGDLKTTDSKFCIVCHYNKKIYRSWQKSGHKKVKCVNCHASGGLTGYFSTKSREGANALNYLLYPNDLKARSAVKNSNCLSCHSDSMRDSLPAAGGFSMNHKGLIEGGFVCADCHTDTGHEIKGAVRPSIDMSLCKRCHDGKKASARCELCHQENGVKVRKDRLDIFKIAIPSMDSCSSCHLNKAQCSRCHYGFVLPHPPQFLSGGHRVYPAAKCYACHKQGPAYCQQCHAAPSNSVSSP